MREQSPWKILKAIPVMQEIGGAVVADLFDDVAVRKAHLGNVRRVDDQLAAIGQHRLEFVHAFATDPEIVIHLWRTGNDGVKRARLVGDVLLGGEIAGGIPGAFRGAEEQACERFVRTYHHTEAGLLDIHHRGRVIHHFTHGRPFAADDHRIGHHRAEPVEKV